MVKAGILFILLIIVSTISNAQQSKCLIDYHGLKQIIDTEQNFTVGSILHIRPEYMEYTNKATRSEYQFFSYKVYSRPANSTERSLKTTVSSLETVENNKVYKNLLTFKSFGFFKVGAGFGGKYDLIQDFSSKNHVPYGIYPADLNYLASKPLRLTKITRYYLLFDVEGLKIVYYIHRPIPLYEVFEYAGNRMMINSKQKKYEFLVDRRVKIIAQNGDLFVKMHNLTDFSPTIDREFECTIIDVKSYADHTIIRYRDKYDLENSLRIDSGSDFLMYDCLCMEGKDELGNLIDTGNSNFGCLIRYGELKTKIKGENRINVGSDLYIKDEYLLKVVGAKISDYRYFGYYEYLRPARGEEITYGLTSSYFHKKINGHIYKDELTFSSHGFFKASGSFGGNYNLMSNGENENHVPFGLFPEDVFELENVPLKLLRLTDKYLVLSANGRKIAYYRNPELELGEVFENAYYRGLITKRFNRFRYLLGKKVRVVKKDQSLLIKSDNMNIFTPLFSKELEFIVDDIKCYPDRTIMYYKDRYGARSGLLIDSKTDFNMYDANCMGRKEETHRLLNVSYGDKIDQYAKGRIPLSNLKRDTTTLNALFLRFNFAPDPKTGIYWYTHKNQVMKDNLMNKYLKMTCTKDGYGYLMSLYTNTNRVNHTSIVASMEGKILNSATIPLGDSDNQTVTEPQSGQIWETVHYTNERDNGIIKMIAQNVEKNIGVRFVGGRNFDIQLSDKHKKAIRDTYVLSSYLKLTTYNQNNE